ncbi:MAG: hypothetical protein AMJ69_08865 [Gammaproteobacteria bacterium SG8_47]|nr:MAG: hypothetical protein AMJ69_08865 [Gammaproteobacteria bacterium SG8_47]
MTDVQFRVAVFASVLLLLAVVVPSQAAPLSAEQVPAPLQPWVDWVLHGEDDRHCPFLYSDAKQRQCAWPTRLELILGADGGRFAQTWQVYRDSWITLPGDERHWPQQVSIDQAQAQVLERDGQPVVRLEAGAYRIGGEFAWDKLPESLAIPPRTGMLALSINGTPVGAPDMDTKGQLWLRTRDAGREERDAEGDRLDVQVFRRIIDETPLQAITHLDLQISGAQREVVLGVALLPEHIPLSLDSPLPARLDANGQLRVQVRPGRWQLRIRSRHPGQITELSLPAPQAFWPGEEAWVFDARNHLRLVEVQDAIAIDPRQTKLPADWQQLPAYRMNAGATLRLKVIRRGDPDPAPDQLTLRRELWLDFAGEGYTIQDQISGSMTRGWRIEASPSLVLGRVAVDGQPQFITALSGADRKGVEVRRGAIDLNADARYTGNVRNVPAVGWDHDFHDVSVQLHLPPGWRLIAAGGTDNVPDTWLDSWTLLDLFVVLITALAVGRMWGWAWMPLALLTLTLIWHEPGLPPRYVWLNILAALALLRVLPPGRFQRVVRWYRNLALLTLVIIAIPFMIQQARIGLFPQLQQQAYYDERPLVSGAYESLPSAVDRVRAPSPARKGVFDSGVGESAVQQVIDPNAQVQTGPGLPQWRWRSAHFSWKGPVSRNQHVKLILFGPTTNLVLSFARIALLIALVVLIGRLEFKRRTQGPPASGAAALLLVLPLIGVGSNIAQAQTTAPMSVKPPLAREAQLPTPDLLQELKARLLEPPDCLPHCAQASRMQLHLNATTLTVRVEYHTQASVAVPLPASAHQWLPTIVTVDGAPAPGLARTDDGSLWLDLGAGVHQVVLSGPVTLRTHFQLPLQLRPHRVDYNVEGWTLDGVHENGVPDAQLQLTRVRADAAHPPLAALEPTTMPSFVRVERTLRLGLDWYVDTRVLRIAPQLGAIVVEVPLLEGESVVSAGVRTQAGKVLVNIPAGEHVFGWRSTLDKHDSIVLTAPQTTTWMEVWRVDVNPIWHLDASGMAVVHHKNAQDRWLPEWVPWPGEQVSLAISRPRGVPGPTLTVDNTQLTITPGKRATDVVLTLSLRSSQGGQHTVTLPEHTVLQSVTINGVAQPIRQDGRQVTLPIVPGTQSFGLSWRADEGIKRHFVSPLVDLGVTSVNSSIHMALASERWVLFTGGPRLGPAVWFWGVLIIILLVAIGLGRVRLTPLKSWHWFLLGVGLTQVHIATATLIVGWLLVLGARGRLERDMNAGVFNAMQVGLGLFTLAALGALIAAIEQGLLGYPAMQIAGNDSSAYQLNWYQDRADTLLPQAWVWSVSLWVYRALMLVWALWLAFSLLRWLRWGWHCYSHAGLWRTLQWPSRRTRHSRPAEQDLPPPR